MIYQNGAHENLAKYEEKFAFFHYTIIKKSQSMFWKDITVFRIFENYDLRFDQSLALT